MDNFLDEKVSLSMPLKLTGRNLFLLLSLGLGIASIGLDLAAGRFLNSPTSLFMPLVVCAVCASGLGSVVVPLLQKLKAGQIIREDGPQAHLKKAGTPTMGGIFFVPVGVAVAVLWSRFNSDVVAVSALTLAYGFIGWLDDWQILRRKSNKGISPRMKLALQIGFAALFCLWLMFHQPTISTNIPLPFGIVLPLGLLFWPLAGFVLVAESNATNLTDGVDGLMGGLGAIALLGLGASVASTSPELMIFCVCMSGSCLGFLTHNRNPARVFMGDTGALALGGALAAVALLTNSLWVLLIISIIFLVETLSVIAQVSYYKATKGPDGIGKRLLKMAPLHHHLELSGWLETQVVGIFYLTNALLVLMIVLLTGNS
ncbi:phospho-N-acetylmuramoyl-pentapeptide-transferase [Microcoleus sp. EPA2]|uniref:phospho-N-acetylmuramoyl-pentapeptide- transferase n=1 Tax=Microcoleus sp. EPA2 TaxID=2841654 RepID=UPI00312BBFD3